MNLSCANCNADNAYTAYHAFAESEMVNTAASTIKKAAKEAFGCSEIEDRRAIKSLLDEESVYVHDATDQSAVVTRNQIETTSVFKGVEGDEVHASFTGVAGLTGTTGHGSLESIDEKADVITEANSRVCGSDNCGGSIISQGGSSVSIEDDVDSIEVISVASEPLPTTRFLSYKKAQRKDVRPGSSHSVSSFDMTKRYFKSLVLKGRSATVETPKDISLEAEFRKSDIRKTGLGSASASTRGKGSTMVPDQNVESPNVVPPEEENFKVEIPIAQHSSASTTDESVKEITHADRPAQDSAEIATAKERATFIEEKVAKADASVESVASKPDILKEDELSTAGIRMQDEANVDIFKEDEIPKTPSAHADWLKSVTPKAEALPAGIPETWDELEGLAPQISSTARIEPEDNAIERTDGQNDSIGAKKDEEERDAREVQHRDAPRFTKSVSFHEPVAETRSFDSQRELSVIGSASTDAGGMFFKELMDYRKMVASEMAETPTDMIKQNRPAEENRTVETVYSEA